MSMSVGASQTLNPALSAMLAQLTPSGSATGNAAPAFSGTSPSAPATGVATGSGKAQVSSDILNLFSQMHQAAGSAHHGGGAGASSGASGSTTTASTASTMIDPLDQLMARDRHGRQRDLDARAIRRSEHAPAGYAGRRVELRSLRATRDLLDRK